MVSPVGEYLAVRDFEELRHYKNRRSLPWIKVEQVLLDDPSFLSVDATQRGLYLMLCLLAARLNNRILFEAVYLGRAMRLDGPVDVSPLIQAGLVQVIKQQEASNVQATCEQTAIECEQSAVREYGDESTKKRERRERVEGESVREGDQGEVSRAESNGPVTEEWIVKTWNEEPEVRKWSGPLEKVMKRRAREACILHPDRMWWQEFLSEFARTPSQDEKPHLLDNALAAAKTPAPVTP